ncbi:transcriptional regulator, Sir2 family [Opisthorchis viverrini]|uniref:protein acetyllysine N-acetyltransferase n=1 Tax=Opisthorchis viverrini TaxID=6198 RepID=A0A1S8XB86_OPIVI|nr:transcriptional regulator, Sir2 family [Opisthorchis viverrini]
MSESSEVVVVSSEEETESRPSLNGDHCSDQELEDSASPASSTSVVSVDDDGLEASDDDDCEIVTVEDTRGEEKWRDVHGPFKMLNALLQAGHTDPRLLLTRMFGMDDKSVPNETSQQWGLLLSLLAEPMPRPRLPHVNTLEKVVELLQSSRFILVVTGAGISVSCGIPDFRSRDGIYARLAKDYPDLSSPQSMFDMSYFLRNPLPFFKFAKEIFPGQFAPSLTHRFVALLESKGTLLRNYTQNIDTLEQAAGITRLIQCHGSFATATCTSCKYQVSGDEIKETVFAQSIPYCPRCRPSDRTTNGSPSSSNSPGGGSLVTGSNGIPKPRKIQQKPKDPSFGVLKPDIVFFGEDLSSEFHDTLAGDVEKADLVLVIGSSLKVRPVAHIPNSIPESVPQILINREPLINHDFDVELLGDCDVIVNELCLHLNWNLPGSPSSQARKFIPLCDLMAERAKGGLQTKLGSKSPGCIEQSKANGLNDVDQTQEQDTTTTAASAQTSSLTDANGTSRLENDRSCLLDDTPDEVVEVEGSDDSELDELWDVAAFLPPDSFTRIPPNQYVFPGAELFISQTGVLPETESEQTGSLHTSPIPAHAQLDPGTLVMTMSEEPSATRLSHFLDRFPGSSTKNHSAQSTTEDPHTLVVPCSAADSFCEGGEVQSQSIPNNRSSPLLPNESPNVSSSPMFNPDKTPTTAVSDLEAGPEVKRSRLDLQDISSCL